MTMAYRITGLSAAQFAPLFALDDQTLASQRAERVTVLAKPGYPCRISLEDAPTGEQLILLHHVCHDVETPYRNAYAIYVRDAVETANFVDAVPPVMAGRPLGLRGFDASGRLRDARLATPGQADAGIRALFANADIAYIHAHNAAHGCFVARVDRQ
jgi:hypothetical protein